MTSNPLFHVERKVFDSPRLHQDRLANQRLEEWALRQLGPQSSPVVRVKAAFGQHCYLARHGHLHLIVLRCAVRGRLELRYISDIELHTLGLIDADRTAQG